MSKNAFAEYCETLNSQCRTSQAIAQTVLDSEAQRALFYARNMLISTAGDVLLFCASINVMNAYVKQESNKKTFGYFFKSYVSRLTDRLETAPIEGVIMSTQRDGGSFVTMVSINGLQFSFHCVPGSKRLAERSVGRRIAFDGVRKQKCASALFSEIESETRFLTNLTTDGDVLMQLSTKCACS